MNLNEYQALALRTDQTVDDASSRLVIPLLGLSGEVGELLSEYKKHLRDGEAHRLFEERISEELGDILWYVAAVGARFGLDLETVAQDNLRKCAASWGTEQLSESVVGRFDRDFPEGERFPPLFRVEFREVAEGGSLRVEASWRGGAMGDPLTDNAHFEDGYRFHDVFHLGCVAGLGWSPVSRRNLRLKRRSDPATDEVEDGGRASVIEEGVSALVYSYAIEHDWLRNVDRVDHDVLKTIMKMTSHLEVSECSIAEWESTILMSYPIWIEVMVNRGGIVEVDLAARSLHYLGSQE